MTADVLKIMGQIAGIGGLSLGVLLLLYRDVLRKMQLGTLTREHSYRAIVLFMVLVWSIAVLGIGAWVYAASIENASGDVEPTKNPIPPRAEFQIVVDGPNGTSISIKIKLVGESKDACARNNIVIIQGKTGSVSVAAGESKMIELPEPTTGLIWQCGEGIRERTTNTLPFKWVLCERTTTGAMHWLFYAADSSTTATNNPTPPNPAEPTITPPGPPVKEKPMSGLVEVGRTRDACARGNAVTFTGKDGDVSVGAQEMKLVELPAFATELIWYCGGSRERCANDSAFNWISCERSDTGAIQWVFYAKR